MHTNLSKFGQIIAKIAVLGQKCTKNQCIWAKMREKTVSKNPRSGLLCAALCQATLAKRHGHVQREHGHRREGVDPGLPEQINSGKLKFE